jgi:hypothetical protein
MRLRISKTRTQRLDIVFVEASLDVFDHETRLAYLRVSNHPDFDHHTEITTNKNAFARVHTAKQTYSFLHCSEVGHAGSARWDQVQSKSRTKQR